MRTPCEICIDANGQFEVWCNGKKLFTAYINQTSTDIRQIANAIIKAEQERLRQIADRIGVT